MVKYNAFASVTCTGIMLTVDRWYITWNINNKYYYFTAVLYYTNILLITYYHFICAFVIAIDCLLHVTVFPTKSSSSKSLVSLLL